MLEKQVVKQLYLLTMKGSKKRTIFGKDSQRECTKYENAVNDAAYDLCVDDITLVNDRKLLFEKARGKVNLSGYNYKRSKSRSKVFGDGGAVPPKKIKLAQEIRKRRVDEIANQCYSLYVSYTCFITILNKTLSFRNQTTRSRQNHPIFYHDLEPLWCHCQKEEDGLVLVISIRPRHQFLRIA
jgi:hypothetical protein